MLLQVCDCETGGTDDEYWLAAAAAEMEGQPYGNSSNNGQPCSAGTKLYSHWIIYWHFSYNFEFLWESVNNVLLL